MRDSGYQYSKGHSRSQGLPSWSLHLPYSTLFSFSTQKSDLIVSYFQQTVQQRGGWDWVQEDAVFRGQRNDPTLEGEFEFLACVLHLLKKCIAWNIVVWDGNRPLAGLAISGRSPVSSKHLRPPTKRGRCCSTCPPTTSAPCTRGNLLWKRSPWSFYSMPLLLELLAPSRGNPSRATHHLFASLQKGGRPLANSLPGAARPARYSAAQQYSHTSSSSPDLFDLFGSLCVCVWHVYQASLRCTRCFVSL